MEMLRHTFWETASSSKILFSACSATNTACLSLPILPVSNHNRRHSPTGDLVFRIPNQVSQNSTLSRKPKRKHKKSCLEEAHSSALPTTSHTAPLCFARALEQLCCHWGSEPRIRLWEVSVTWLSSTMIVNQCVTGVRVSLTKTIKTLT